MYSAPWRLKIQRCSDDRELNQARLKPDIVDRPVRTARTFMCHYNSTQYCSTETVFLTLPFLQTNITSQIWPSGGKGEVECHNCPDKLSCWDERASQYLVWVNIICLTMINVTSTIADLHSSFTCTDNATHVPLVSLKMTI